MQSGLVLMDITMPGVGGIEATRCIREAHPDTRVLMVMMLSEDFPDGVYFVDLAPIREPPLVIGAIAHTLGLREIGGQPLSDQLAQYAAVALFMQRTVDASADFQLTNANAAAVAEICTRLDGLPLALELAAAARIKLFPPAALLARLSSRLALLAGRVRDLPLRQQTMRDTIAWSDDLLTEAEQTLLRRLGVFVGGCTLQAAEGVCRAMRTRREGNKETTEKHVPSASPELPVSVLDCLAALMDKSLLCQVEGSGEEPRFVMLETIREYALERLEASGETARLRQLHARYYVSHWDLPHRIPTSPAPLAQLERDYDNLWSALVWSQTEAGDPEIGVRLAGGLRTLWMRRGMRREAIAALERSLNHPRGVGHAAARFGLGHFLVFTTDYAAARHQLEQAVQLAREVGDQGWAIVALERLGWLAREQGDSAAAWARLSESLAICREAGDADSIASGLGTMAGIAILEEDPLQAEALLAERRALRRSEPDPPNTRGWVLNSLGHVAQLRGEYDRAAQLHHESRACFQAYGDYNPGRLYAYHNLGETMLGLGKVNEAARWLGQGLMLSQTPGDRARIAWCLGGLGSVAAMDEEPERAARLWGAAERLRQAIGCRSAPAARATYERALAAARTQLSEEAFAAAWTEGQMMTLEQAAAYSLEGSGVAAASSSGTTAR